MSYTRKDREYYFLLHRIWAYRAPFSWIQQWMASITSYEGWKPRKSCCELTGVCFSVKKFQAWVSPFSKILLSRNTRSPVGATKFSSSNTAVLLSAKKKDFSLNLRAQDKFRCDGFDEKKQRGRCLRCAICLRSSLRRYWNFMPERQWCNRRSCSALYRVDASRLKK